MQESGAPAAPGVPRRLEPSRSQAQAPHRHFALLDKLAGHLLALLEGAAQPAPVEVSQGALMSAHRRVDGACLFSVAPR